MLRSSLVAFAALCAPALAAIAGSAAEAAKYAIQKPPLNPDDDPFYQAPQNVASIKLGEIIRSRPIPTPVTMDNKEPGVKMAKTVQILYRTQNSLGKPLANVMTVMVPMRAKFDHIMAFSYFSDAAYNA